MLRYAEIDAVKRYFALPRVETDSPVEQACSASRVGDRPSSPYRRGDSPLP